MLRTLVWLDIRKVNGQCRRINIKWTPTTSNNERQLRSIYKQFTRIWMFNLICLIVYMTLAFKVELVNKHLNLLWFVCSYAIVIIRL